MAKPLKVAYFAGGSKDTLKPFYALINSKHNLKAVYTKIPKPSGRGQKKLINKLFDEAKKNKIKVETINNFEKLEDINKINSLNLDIIVVFSYGILIPKKVLETPKLGCINIHTSLLPKWRGASPIQHTLLNNDKETGFTFILMNERLDEGDIILSQKLKINSTDNYQDLLNRIVDLASKELVTTIEKIFSNKIKLLPQDHNKATYCYRIKKEETYLNFVNTAQEVYGKIRALSPSPGAKFYLKGELIKALEAKVENNTKENNNCGITLDNNLLVSCKVGTIRLIKIQRPGKKVMNVKDVLNGWPIGIGEILNER